MSDEEPTKEDMEKVGKEILAFVDAMRLRLLTFKLLLALGDTKKVNDELDRLIEELKVGKMSNMYTRSYERILLDAITTYGRDAQSLKAVEEMAELTKAILKHRERMGGCSPSVMEARRLELVEELADVWIMLDQLEIIYCHDGELAANVERKMDALEMRLDRSGA